MNTSVTLLASCTTSTPTDISGVNIHDYKILFLSAGTTRGNYCSNIAFSCLIPDYIIALHCVCFNTSGAVVGGADADFYSSKLSARNTTYPAYLYGIN